MKRVVWFLICTIIGLELIGWALLIPAHLRTVDAHVLELTSSDTSLVGEGLSLVDLEKTGPAHLLLDVARQTEAPGTDKLAAALQSFETAHPKLRVWGGAAMFLERAFEKNPATANLPSQPIIDLLLAQNERNTLLDALRHSRRPGVLEILQTRALTNTVLFPPATSASGQPLDATIAVTALLFQQDALAGPLRESIQALVAKANQGVMVQPLEEIYFNIHALGKRLDWGQLTDLIRRVPNAEALRETAQLVQEKEQSLPILFSAIHFSDSAHPVRLYLDAFPATGLRDLSFALRSGSGAVHELLERQEPIHYPTWRDWLVTFGPLRAAYEPLARLTANQPLVGFCIKYGLCLLGALLVARALTYLSPSLAQEIDRSRPFVTGPQVAIACCLFFLVLFCTESLVTRSIAPSRQLPVQVKFPVASAALRATIPHQLKTFMDTFSALSLLVFFVLQAIIYLTCRVKLAEIRQQSVSSKLKLRLLENEEHLFDAGLYFGFVGTVLALILFSLGIHQFSLMAAYSSTSFGIIFVSILKIFSVRPYRRRLILDADMSDRQPTAA
jgi:hypothetical protein